MHLKKVAQVGDRPRLILVLPTKVQRLHQRFNSLVRTARLEVTITEVPVGFGQVGGNDIPLDILEASNIVEKVSQQRDHILKT